MPGNLNDRYIFLQKSFYLASLLTEVNAVEKNGFRLHSLTQCPLTGGGINYVAVMERDPP